MPKNQILRENHESATPSAFPNLKSKSIAAASPSSRRQNSSKENSAPTSDPNSTVSPATAKMKSPLPPRPTLKRKLSVEAAVGLENSDGPTNPADSGVKVNLWKKTWFQIILVLLQLALVREVYRIVTFGFSSLPFRSALEFSYCLVKPLYVLSSRIFYFILFFYLGSPIFWNSLSLSMWCDIFSINARSMYSLYRIFWNKIWFFKWFWMNEVVLVQLDFR